MKFLQIIVNFAKLGGVGMVKQTKEENASKFGNITKEEKQPRGTLLLEKLSWTEGGW